MTYETSSAPPLDGGEADDLWQAQAAGTQQSQPQRPNPFADVPVLDYLRDLVALILLAASLTGQWTLEDEATDRIEVVLITALSIMSLLLPYLSRVGLFSPTWTLESLRKARLVANAPYLLLVIVHVVIDVVSGLSSPTGLSEPTGLGVAAWWGLAGAILAAQPREAEVRDAGARRYERFWFGLTAAFAALLGASLILNLVAILRAAGDFGPAFTRFAVLTILIVLVQAVLIAAPLVGTLARSGAWRRVLVISGAIVGCALTLQLSDDAFLNVESVHLPPYAGVLWWLAAAASASSPSVRRCMKGPDGVLGWVVAASRTGILIVILAGVAVAVMVVAMVITDGDIAGTFVLIVIAYTLAAVISALAVRTLRRDPRGSRGLVLVLAAIILILGLVNVVAANVSDAASTLPYAVIGRADALLLGLPIGLALFLTVPAEVRRAYAGVPMFSRQWQVQPFGAEAASTQTPGPSDRVQPQMTARRLSEATQSVHVDKANAWDLARDPATPQQTLAELAYSQSDVRPLIAENPSTYPGLLEWLQSLHDPAVDQALARRRA